MVKPLFLDTTIQVDRVLKEQPPRQLAALQTLLGQFDFLVACSFSRLEFKRVVIQNLALLLGYLVEEQSFLGALQRAQKIGAKQPRRLSTLISVATWVGFQIDSQVEVVKGQSVDRQLALKAESYIRNAITFLWKRFDRSVASIQDGTQCKRATENPRRLDDGTFDVAVSESKCKTKECNNANFFRAYLPQMKKLRDHLQKLAGDAAGSKLTAELETALQQLKSAISSPARLYDYQNCLSLGDVWIHLECLAAKIKDFATTNYKESQILCPTLGLKMRQPE